MFTVMARFVDVEQFDQAENIQPELAVAVSVMSVFCGTSPEHVVLPAPHEMSEGELVTVPIPVTFTVRAWPGAASNRAVHVRAWFAVRPKLGMVPVVQLDHPTNVLPFAAVAVKVTCVPWS